MNRARTETGLCSAIIQCIRGNTKSVHQGSSYAFHFGKAEFGILALNSLTAALRCQINKQDIKAVSDLREKLADIDGVFYAAYHGGRAHGVRVSDGVANFGGA